MTAEIISPILSPIPAKIKEHLIYLFGNIPPSYNDGLIEISVLNASKYFAVQNLDAAIEQAVIWNNEGKNVYTCPAVLSPDLFESIEKRRQADIALGKEKKGYRAEGADFYCSSHVWVDVDEIEDSKIPELKEKYKSCPPDYYVKTSTTPPLKEGDEKKVSVHFWWSIKDVIDVFEAEKMEQANKHLIHNLFGDKGTHNRTRLMRLGGTVSYPKKDYRLKEMVNCQFTATKNTYSLDNIIEGFPITQEKPLFQPVPEYTPKLPLLNVKNEWSLEDIQSMLNVIDADGNGVYDDWLAIGMSLKDYGVPFHIYDAWCSKGSKYEGTQENQKKWDSFNGKGRTIGTVYYHAKQAGWEPKRASNVLNYVPQEVKFDAETGEIIEGKKSRFHYINAPDISHELDTNDFVQGLLSKAAMSVVYGESNCGKTFFMTDLAFHVVEGKKWNGKRVERGNVLYVILEGSYGLKNRIAAYKKETGSNLNGFLMMPCAVDFTSDKETDDDDIHHLLYLVEEAKAKLGDIKLIVIDTLARAVGGGDENSGQDMGRLVKHADFIRQHTGAHICFIHHSGKDRAKGARGHSSLRAAVDTEIEISRQEGADYSEVKIAKQRDMEIGEPSNFKLRSVVLGQNKYGEDVLSCVVEPYILEEDTQEFVHKKIKSGKTKTAFDALLECIMDKGAVKNNKDLPRIPVVLEDQFKEYLVRRGLLSDNSKSATVQYIRIRNDLIENNLAVYRDGYVWSNRSIN